MNIKFTILGSFFVFTSSIIFGQTTENKDKPTPVCVQYEHTKLKKNIPETNAIENKVKDPEWNTFEFISLDGKNEAFSKKIIPMLEEMRKENEDVYYQISEHTKIKILSKSVINSDDFKKSIK